MKINWSVRFKNKAFVIAFVSAILLLTQAVLRLFGVDWDFTQLNTEIENIIEAVFGILVLLGVVNDPTTKGYLKDSDRAMGYDEPN